jgi:drug/metabolite transporter (DMT)-like permease
MNQPEATQGEIDTPGRVTRAELALLIVTAVWGLSFVLAKGAGTTLNAAAGQTNGAVGPVTVLAIRFALSALLWMVLIPRSVRGWTRRSTIGGVIVGGLLSGGLMLQSVGLDYTIEAVSAFLTSLAVVFVPLVLWLFFKTPPTLAAVVGVVLAVPGVWMLSETQGFSLGLGEWLGISCAFVFTWHLIAINHFTPLDSPWRMTLQQFGMVTIVCGATATALLMRADGFDWSVFASVDFWWRMGVLVVGPTVICFGAMTYFQPRVPPTRAVLIYLFEPVFAALFAYLIDGRTMTWVMIAGGGLILAANVAVELLPKLRKPGQTP